MRLNRLSVVLKSSGARWNDEKASAAAAVAAVVVVCVVFVGFMKSPDGSRQSTWNKSLNIS